MCVIPGHRCADDVFMMVPFHGRAQAVVVELLLHVMIVVVLFVVLMVMIAGRVMTASWSDRLVDGRVH